MAKKNPKRSGSSIPLPKGRQDDAPPPPPHHPSQNAVRETFESLAIAFMLAFFIRTFVVEPFVIPTGSMSPALQGVHDDLNCPQCGHRYLVNASAEAPNPRDAAGERCVGGMCPMCRYTMAYDEGLAGQFTHSPQLSRDERPYSGDRIIVNKFLYSFTDPERWSVVVFKFPGNATDNYIKRLVGLPEETIRIFGGDLYTRHDGESEFHIARKPAEVAYAMREEVHDNFFDPDNLHEAGWPLRWQVVGDNSAWKTTDTAKGKLVRRQYSVSGEGENWIEYVHTPPPNPVWPTLEAGGVLPPANKQLVSDFNSYNTRIPFSLVNYLKDKTNDPFVVFPTSQGVHWVGDLFVEANVDVRSDSGQLMLELVEAGHHFRCTLDVATGKAQLTIAPHGTTEPTDAFAASAGTLVKGPGSYKLMFANVDDTLHLWIDDRLVQFDGATEYDWESLFGSRKDAVPQTSETDLGDLAPARVGSSDASLAVDRLRVYRDIYYIAARDSLPIGGGLGIVADYRTPPPPDLLSNPMEWDFIARRQEVEFPLAKDQFFVMGDNSPQSSDARLWTMAVTRNGSPTCPGGNYLERQLLIGRAISVVWPHPWHYVIPNVTDMRRIQ